jgi:hypothetical protein
MAVRVMLADHSTKLVRNIVELTAEHARINEAAKQDGRIHLDLMLTPA